MSRTEEKPVIVLLHGAGTGKELWAPQVNVLSKTYCVIALDLPGHADIRPVDSISEMAAYVHDRVMETGIRKFAVAGLSLGGMVALEIALRWPKDVTHLALIETVPNVTKNRFGLLFARSIIFLLQLINPRWLTLLPARYMGAETKAAGDYIKTALCRMTARNIYLVLKAGLDYDASTRLSMLSLPALIIVGEKNKSTHKRGEAMSRQIRNSQFLVAPNAGHIANRDAPAFINRALEELLLQDAQPTG